MQNLHCGKLSRLHKLLGIRGKTFAVSVRNAHPLLIDPWYMHSHVLTTSMDEEI